MLLPLIAPATKKYVRDPVAQVKVNREAYVTAVLTLIVAWKQAGCPRTDVEPIAMTVLVNPHLEILSEEHSSGWEGCLSVPGMRGFVPRYSTIRYRGFDEFGNAIKREADGFHARVFQHEFDHLEGILYPDKIEDILSFGFTEEVQAANAS